MSGNVGDEQGGGGRILLGEPWMPARPEQVAALRAEMAERQARAATDPWVRAGRLEDEVEALRGQIEALRAETERLRARPESRPESVRFGNLAVRLAHVMTAELAQDGSGSSTWVLRLWLVGARSPWPFDVPFESASAAEAALVAVMRL